MKLLVSIHDVSPANAEGVRQLWSLCTARGILPALFVVPNWHGAYPLERYVSFVGWLRQCAAEGAEIFLHGERHDEAGLLRGWGDEVRALGHSSGEGEFLTLDQRAAHQRIVRGLGRLRRLGLDPIGFAAPAWLWRSEARGAVWAAGLRLSEDDHAVYLHGRGMRLASPVLRWNSRTTLQSRVAAGVASLMTRFHRRNWLVRIALHPGDVRHEVAARSATSTLDRWLAVRHPFTYASL